MTAPCGVLLTKDSIGTALFAASNLAEDKRILKARSAAPQAPPSAGRSFRAELS